MKPSEINRALTADRTVSDEKLAGVLVVDKPLGWSSMDVVRVVRRSVRAGRGKHKVGHAGTLDPLATGVMVVCVGAPATRRVNRLMDTDKAYESVFDLSAFTETDDAEEGVGREEIAVQDPPSRAVVEAALAGMVGTVMQTPPVFSAVHVQGVRAYKAARNGEEVKLRPRPVRIETIDILGYDWPRVKVQITCGKGTYIRSIARDLGKRLGTGGFVAELRRTAVGRYTVADATPIERFKTRLEQVDLMPVPGEND